MAQSGETHHEEKLDQQEYEQSCQRDVGACDEVFSESPLPPDRHKDSILPARADSFHCVISHSSDLLQSLNPQM